MIACGLDVVMHAVLVRRLPLVTPASTVLRFAVVR